MTNEISRQKESQSNDVVEGLARRRVHLHVELQYLPLHKRRHTSHKQKLFF